jgi:AcrR family transcriptional regulator
MSVADINVAQACQSLSSPRIHGMARWEPDSRGRLEEAALELYGERGYDSTTVAEIAKRAGVTERTFFRHFADKREVLFGGAGPFQETLLTPVADAPAAMAPIDAAALGLAAVATALQERRELALKRQAVIAANPDLQERELTKLASLSAQLADTLRRRAVPDTTASLAAETAMAVFKTAFDRWIDEFNDREFPELMRESLDELRALTAGSSRPARASS